MYDSSYEFFTLEIKFLKKWNILSSVQTLDFVETKRSELLLYLFEDIEELI